MTDKDFIYISNNIFPVGEYKCYKYESKCY